MFSFHKPDYWHLEPLYKKISYYKTQLNEKIANYVDKLEAKKIVHNLESSLEIATVVRILKDSTDFHESDRKSGHVLKAVHGSGWNIIDLKKMNLEQILLLLKEWNSTYYGNNETHYKYIKPRFFIEEKLIDKFGGDDLTTYMFRCIHGQPETFSIKKNGKINNYSMDGIPLKPREHSITIENLNHLFDKMKTFAKILSEPFEFVRIDFFINDKNQIYFSEFTFTPFAGKQYYTHDIEVKLGKLWK